MTYPLLNTIRVVMVLVLTYPLLNTIRVVIVFVLTFKMAERNPIFQKNRLESKASALGFT